MNAEFKVWWVPQVPMKAFEISVPDVAAGRLLCDTLGKYDAFQFENRIKPDYCNAGGVMFRHAITKNEWWDWPEDEEEAADLISEMTKDPTNGVVRDKLSEAAVESRLSQAGAGGGVVVKPLEWNPFRAETAFGYYHIDDQTDRSPEEQKGRQPFLLSGSRLTLTRHASLDEAKAAAQADYDARILAALAPSPSAGEPFGWVVGPVFFEEDPGALLGKRAVFVATPPAPVSAPSPAGGRAVAWRCRDLILGGVSIIDDERHAEARARQTDAWSVEPLYAAPTHAVAAEREACALVADQFKLGEFRNGQPVFADDVAAAIRARSTLEVPMTDEIKPSPAGGVREALEALRPFASTADHFDDYEVTPDTPSVLCTVRLADLRRARTIVRDAALPATPEPVSAPAGEVVEAARGIVSAWEALPGGGYYGLRIVQEWLADRMKPAMDNLRAALSNPAPGHGEVES